MKTPALHDQTWPYVVTLLPPDFEERARSARALVRCRNIPNATALLRLALAYAVSDLSLKDVAAWAHALEVAEITGPGSKGTDWRVHVQVDPATGALRSVQVTDAHGGESYGRLPPEAGDVVLGDQGYARARGIAAVRQAQAHVVVRVSPHSIRLCNPERKVLRPSLPWKGCAWPKWPQGCPRSVPRSGRSSSRCRRTLPPRKEAGP